MKHTLYVMSSPILAPKDAHVILSKVTANTMLIHNAFTIKQVVLYLYCFQSCITQEIGFEISTSKQISIM